ncbi:hypothetical protein ACX3VG_09545, partial [Escherichia coli]
DRGAKVIASAYSDLGFDVDLSPMFSTPEELSLIHISEPTRLDVIAYAVFCVKMIRNHWRCVPTARPQAGA